jgi:outer membrane murein-binding lipoprotein Lpp/outer membrane protein assembly factor BamE (lipoprotein component of BamABCDE complex)
MRAYRILSCLVAVIVSLSLVNGCSRGPSEEELKQAELAEQFATITQLYETLTQTRADLESAQSSLAEIEALAERERSEEQQAMMEELPAQIEELTASQDATFEEMQAELAEYLNVALNDFPDSPDTARALGIYSEEAIIVAYDIVQKSGDYKKAIDHLASAENLFEQSGLATYQPLVDHISELDDWRYITQERFDSVKKNMTKEEVKVLVGVPYYQNIKIDDKRGVEMWLYRKRGGGAAAISFRTKTDKVYHMNFDAVKPQVADE